MRSRCLSATQIIKDNDDQEKENLFTKTVQERMTTNHYES